MVDKIFAFSVRNRSRIILVFKLFYVGQIILLYLGVRAVLKQSDSFIFFYNLAVNFGRAGIVFYILTVLPGMCRRFGIKHKLISTLMIFRRYLGISSFMSILVHFFVIRGTGLLFLKIYPLFSRPFFEMMGLSALILLLPMFLTSNDVSVKFLGIWWKWIHKLTYIIIWFIMLHVTLQRVSLWSVLVSIVLIGQVASFFYKWMKRKISSEMANNPSNLN